LPVEVERPRDGLVVARAYRFYERAD